MKHCDLCDKTPAKTYQIALYLTPTPHGEQQFPNTYRNHRRDLCETCTNTIAARLDTITQPPKTQ